MPRLKQLVTKSTHSTTFKDFIEQSLCKSCSTTEIVFENTLNKYTQKKKIRCGNDNLKVGFVSYSEHNKNTEHGLISDRYLNMIHNSL